MLLRNLFAVLVMLTAAVVHAGDKPVAAAVASADPLATQAGLEVLEAGGNAFDAAVAVSAALGVVEPTGSGLGGGGFWLLHRAQDGLEVMVDGRERAPLAARRDMFLDARGEVVPGLSIDGPLAVGIPGEPAALAHIAERYGRLPLSRSLAPAIRYAREGFPVTPFYQHMAELRLRALQASPETSRILLDNGAVPAVGQRVRQPDLAATLEVLAKQGAAGIYAGPLAERLVAGVRKAGGLWSLQDLAGYRVVEREPIHGEYQGLHITSAAPPSSGGVALVTMLNILKGYDQAALPSVERKHLIIEAMRRAYRDRAEYLGDPDFVDVPVSRLTSPLYAEGLRASINPERATPSALLPGVAKAYGGKDTTHFSILDRDGNYVSATLSINYPFGSGFIVPGTGILLNDEMDDFSAKPGVPNVYGLVGAEANAIAPGKRMLSSMTPTFVSGPDGVAILGTPGGSRIITMVLLGILDYANGNGPASWVSKPRFHHQFLPDQVFYEKGALTDDELFSLEDKGHQLQEVTNFGNMQAVLWDKKNHKVEAASDPRVEGAAEVR